MIPGAVAVIDAGSNSVKLLVARRGADGRLEALAAKTLDVRISAGISAATPRIGDDGMTRGSAAIATLYDESRRFSPVQTVVVATSAVRQAANGPDFAMLVLRTCGTPLRILSGPEEAALIGRGLLCDPALAELRDFQVFDLGGGSLECLSFRDRDIRQALSLPLGCVRLTEMFVPDPSKPFAGESARRISSHVVSELAKSGFEFAPSPLTASVGTGGTVSTVRAMAAAMDGKTFEQTDPFVSVEGLRRLLAAVGALPLDSRRRLPGLPPERADVFPAALAILIALADAGRIGSFQNSVYNLRWGLAAEALGG